MNLQGIVARSGQAFKYILDPNIDLISAPKAAQLAEVKRQLAEAQQQLKEGERTSREKDALIAQLRADLVAKEQEAASASAQKAQTTRKRTSPRKRKSEAKTGDITPKRSGPQKNTRQRKANAAKAAGESTKSPTKRKKAAKPRRPRQSDENRSV